MEGNGTKIDDAISTDQTNTTADIETNNDKQPETISMTHQTIDIGDSLNKQTSIINKMDEEEEDEEEKMDTFATLEKVEIPTSDTSASQEQQFSPTVFGTNAASSSDCDKQTAVETDTPEQQNNQTCLMSQSSVDAQMEKVINNIVELDNCRRFGRIGDQTIQEDTKVPKGDEKCSESCRDLIDEEKELLVKTLMIDQNIDNDKSQQQQQLQQETSKSISIETQEEELQPLPDLKNDLQKMQVELGVNLELDGQNSRVPEVPLSDVENFCSSAERNVDNKPTIEQPSVEKEQEEENENQSSTFKETNDIPDVTTEETTVKLESVENGKYKINENHGKNYIKSMIEKSPSLEHEELLNTISESIERHISQRGGKVDEPSSSQNDNCKKGVSIPGPIEENDTEMKSGDNSSSPVNKQDERIEKINESSKMAGEEVVNQKFERDNSVNIEQKAIANDSDKERDDDQTSYAKDVVNAKKASTANRMNLENQPMYPSTRDVRMIVDQKSEEEEHAKNESDMAHSDSNTVENQIVELETRRTRPVRSSRISKKLEETPKPTKFTQSNIETPKSRRGRKAQKRTPEELSSKLDRNTEEDVNEQKKEAEVVPEEPFKDKSAKIAKSEAKIHKSKTPDEIIEKDATKSVDLSPEPVIKAPYNSRSIARLTIESLRPKLDIEFVDRVDNNNYKKFRSMDPSGIFECPECDFTTTRINNLVIHVKAHTNDCFKSQVAKYIKSLQSPKRNNKRSAR